MGPISVLFWSLVLVTCLVSYRWGSMAALVFFVFALMTGAVAVSHWPAL
jgi:hypothetical protein